MNDLDRKSYNAVLIWQLYLERYKNGQDVEIERALNRVSREVRTMLQELPVEAVSDMTRAEFDKLLVRIKDLQLRIYAEIERDQTAEAEAVADTSYLAFFTAFGLITGRSVTRRTQNPLGSAMGGTGLTPRDLLSRLTRSSVLRVLDALRVGRANQLSMSEILTSLFGNNQTRGVFGTIITGWKSTWRTLIQYVVQHSINNVAKLFTDKYKWVSVIDDATTDICRSRDGNIYSAGGPIPPAHYNCRSTIWPVFSDAPGDGPDFGAWLSGMSAQTREKIVGIAIAQEELQGYTFTQVKKRLPRLTVAQLKQRVKNLTTTE